MHTFSAVSNCPYHVEKTTALEEIHSMRESYLFNLDTIATYSNFSCGNEYTGVLEGKENFFVNQSPLTIVQNSFLEIGNELEGARKSSRHNLNKRKNLPVALSVSNNIILIQCKAACSLGGDVWIVAKHIVSIETYKTNQTLIHTTDGHTLIVDMKPERVQYIRNLAVILQTSLLKNQKLQSRPTYIEKYSGFLLVKENGQINYTVKKKK
jgi:competence transcription factor ComK